MSASSDTTSAACGAAGRAVLLGTVAIIGPGGTEVPVTRPQVQLLLAHLLWERRPTTTDAVAELLWGDQPLSPHWRGAVRGVVSKTREVLAEASVAADLVATGDGILRLVLPEGFRTDVADAEAAATSGSEALERGDPGEALALVAPWLDAVERPFLVAADGEWVRWAQARVQDLGRRTQATAARALLALGRADAAVATATRWVAAHPFDEAAHHTLIEALVADGRRPEAVAAHDRLADLLATELGLGPAAATTALLGTAPALPAPPPRAPGRASAPPPAPGPHAAFLGRIRELHELQQAWSQVDRERAPALVVLRGPSGIGKTRLAAELASSVQAAGATVLWSRCSAGAALPFEPLASTVAAAAGGTVHQELSALLDPASAPTGEPELTRARVFRLVAAGIAEVSAEPSLLVVDDLQWAGDDVLGLLEQTLTDLREPLLVVATGREMPERIHDAIARLGRQIPLRTLSLGGLEAQDLEPLFPGSASGAPRLEAAELHRRTGGHPFFVSEIAGASERTGQGIDPAALPDAVREWLSHRLDALPRDLRTRLDLAAVIGPTFSARTVAACSGTTPDQVVDQLEELAELGFVVETDQLDVFAFPHLITQETVYARLGPTRCARLHAAVGQALAADGGPTHHASAAEHLRAAGPEHAAEAARHARLAGAAALERGAWSLAEEQFRAALEPSNGGHADRAGAAHRASSLVGLASALHLQRRREEAEDRLEEAVALARAERLPVELGEAAVALSGRAGRGASMRLTDLEQAGLLDEALRGLGQLPAPTEHEELVRREQLAARLEVELALALSLTEPLALRSALIASAIARAERMDPPDAHLTARVLLGGRSANLDPAQLPARLADLDRVLALAPGSRTVDTTLTAHTYRHEDLLRLGRRPDARRELATATALAEAVDHPYWRWATATWAALDAVIDGDLDLAEERALAAVSMPEADQAGAMACLGVNLVNIRLFQGRSGEMVDLLAQAADDHPEIPCYRAVLALCAVAAGDLAVGTVAYEHFRAGGFDAIPHDTNRLLALAVLADAAVQLGDREAADELSGLLLPHAGHQVLLNCYGGGGAFWGPVDHQLGRLALMTGHHDQADRWLRTAHEAAAAVGSPLALARVAADAERARA